MLVRVLLLIFFIYLAYRLVFDFILPVYKTTRHVKSQFRTMQDQMDAYMKQQEAAQQSRSTQTEKKENSKESDQVGEYIDFEELK